MKISEPHQSMGQVFLRLLANGDEWVYYFDSIDGPPHFC